MNVRGGHARCYAPKTKTSPKRGFRVPGAGDPEDPAPGEADAAYRQVLRSAAAGFAALPTERKPTQVAAPETRAGRTIAAAPFGGCWPGT